MDARYLHPDIVITVRRTLHPFRHSEQQARDVFASHPNKENLWQSCHAAILRNYAELINMGPRPLLDHQTKEGEQTEWIHSLLNAEGTEDWLRLLMRKENLYNRGFINQHNAHECTEPKVSKKRSEPVAAGEDPMEMTGATKDMIESPTERTK